MPSFWSSIYYISYRNHLVTLGLNPQILNVYEEILAWITSTQLQHSDFVPVYVTFALLNYVYDSACMHYFNISLVLNMH